MAAWSAWVQQPSNSHITTQPSPFLCRILHPKQAMQNNICTAPSLLPQAFKSVDVQKIEFLLAAGAKLQHIQEGSSTTRYFCDMHRCASRLRLALAAAGRAGADLAYIPLITHMLLLLRYEPCTYLLLLLGTGMST